MAHVINKTSTFSYDNVSQSWKPSTVVPTRPSLSTGEAFRVISWNIDFMEPFQPERVAAALIYLEGFLRDRQEPTVILLQEIMGSSLETLLASPWVKEKFQISHVRPEDYSIYFTITLVSRNIEAAAVFRVPLSMSCMGRDGLFVDLSLSHSPTADRKSILRICNTHLESLPSGNSIRPKQLCQISTFLKTPPTPDAEVAAGLVGGDMNAISPNDEDLHRRPEIDLKDVHDISQKSGVPFGSSDDGPGGKEVFTWGYQPGRQYPPGRLDKIMFTGELRPTDLSGEPCMRRLGVGLKAKVQDDEDDEDGEDGEDDEGDEGDEPGLGEKGNEVEVWVSDHFGITATFTVLDTGRSDGN